MFVTKIVVTWLAVGTIKEVYNFAGGKEMRNNKLSDSYMGNELDGKHVRTVITVLGIVAITILTMLNWFLTPSSRIYCYVGLKIEKACCRWCRPKPSGTAVAEVVAEDTADELMGLSKRQIYF
jgi:hypothetical protein